MFANLTDAWFHALLHIMHDGVEVSPRQQTTYEILHNTVAFDMKKPVVTSPMRKLNYRFMAAEAFWILSGDDSTENIVPFNSNLAKFSDDGQRFFGAYGPPFVEQLGYVVEKLIDDPMSRQAVMTIWRQNPPQTKDMPCTVAISFDIRDGKLNMHVFMRSSDVWLGLPYDGFTFSMMTYMVCGRLKRDAPMLFGSLEPGQLFLTAASQHLYEVNMDAAVDLAKNDTRPDQLPAQSSMWSDPEFLMHTLSRLRTTSKGDVLRWWEM